MAGNFREYRTRAEMVTAGWSIASTESTCRNCGGSITWAKSPKGKSVPLDSNSVLLHFKSCSNGGAPPAPAPQTSSKPLARAYGAAPTASDFAALQQSMDELAQATRALCSLLRARAGAAR